MKWFIDDNDTYHNKTHAEVLNKQLISWWFDSYDWHMMYMMSRQWSQVLDAELHQ